MFWRKGENCLQLFAIFAFFLALPATVALATQSTAPVCKHEHAVKQSELLQESNHSGYQEHSEHQHQDCHTPEHSDDCNSSCALACDHSCCPKIDLALEHNWTLPEPLVETTQPWLMNSTPRRVAQKLFRPPKA